MTTYAVTLRLAASGAAVAEHFGRVVDGYEVLEQRSSTLLDCAWSLTDGGAAGEVDVSVTVEADDETEAASVVDGAVRSAIDDADRRAGTDTGAVTYRVTARSVAPLVTGGRGARG